METDLYPGVDRGTFLIPRLNSVHGRVNSPVCRPVDVVVYNYLTDFKYAIIAYSIEYWPGEPANPLNLTGGQIYAHKDRPQFNRFFLRTASSTTTKILHIEDAVINDFLTKSLKDPMLFNNYTTEAADQVSDMSKWRDANHGVKYKDGIHITRLSCTETSPLQVTSATLEATVKRGAGADQKVTLNTPFKSVRDCVSLLESSIA